MRETYGQEAEYDGSTCSRLSRVDSQLTVFKVATFALFALADPLLRNAKLMVLICTSKAKGLSVCLEISLLRPICLISIEGDDLQRHICERMPGFLEHFLNKSLTGDLVQRVC